VRRSVGTRIGQRYWESIFRALKLQIDYFARRGDH